MSTLAEGRRKGYKKNLDQNEGRRRREETTVQIRKAKKELQLAKRRQNPVKPVVDNGSNAADISTELQEIVTEIKASNPKNLIELVTKIRRLLSIEKNPPIQQVIDTGIVPYFVDLIRCDDNPELQFEAAWALTNIASGTLEHTQVVIQLGAVPIFVHLLTSPNDDVREQAVWALGNIAGDSAPCRDLVLRSGVMQPMLQNFHPESKLSMLRNATWALSNFCRGKPQPNFDMVKQALPLLAQLILSPDEEIITDACWALSYLSDGTNNKIQAVIDTGACSKLCELLLHPSYAVQTPALRTIGNIATGDDYQTQVVIKNNVLSFLLALLSSPKKGIRKDTCWTISNITAGNEQQIQEVIDNNIIPPLLQILATAEFEIRKEAAWAISNATSGGNPQQIHYLVQHGAIRPLCDLLVVNDTKILTIALEGLENILKLGKADATRTRTNNQLAIFVAEADGLTKIEQLQYHHNNDIYEKSVSILDNYFGIENQEEEMNDLAPEVTEEGNTFAFTQPRSMNTNLDFSN